MTHGAQRQGADRIHQAGLWLLALSVPLLLWNALPENQVLLPAPVFLVAHSLMEIFAIIVAALIFFTAYGTRETTPALRVVVLGAAFLATALFDIFHFLSYVGMPDVVSQNTAHKSILFWLSGRIFAALGLLLYILLAESRLAYPALRTRILLGTLLAVALIVALILYRPDAFPAMFVDGRGLTPVKVALEWLVFGLFAAATWLLYQRRKRVVNCEVRSLLMALALMAMGELFFTFYVQVVNSANLLGHVYKVSAYIFLFRAIFAEAVRQPFQQIQKMLASDELTGLASRAAFNDRLAQAIIDAGRARSHCSVILLGLDHFKTVNATLGHERGDLLLTAVAERIRASLPPSAFIGRFSGDNFVILLERSSVEQGRDAGADLLNVMQQEFDIGTDRIEIGASLGVVSYPADGDSVSELLRHADVALHSAKAAGRRGLALFSQELGERIQRRALLEARMKHAIERGEFALHYQPKVGLPGGEIDGWEALLRWQSPELGAVSPLEFIPVAEECGMINPIGDWVLREACRQARDWLAEGLLKGSIAVNLSPRQFRQKDLATKIETIRREVDLPPHALSLEITESVIMDNPVAARATLDELSRLGILTSVDDFGTGHSSLSYLKTFPIDSLKIDRSFIRDIPLDEHDVAIVRAIIGLGHSLGLRVVAEGVETEEQLTYLCDEGCDAIQGFLFSPSLPASDCAALARSGRRVGVPARC